MKLSRTGWNNVIIISVMAFILVINITNNKLFFSDDKSSPISERYILGKHATILTLSISPTITIERIGKAWRSTPDVISAQALDQMMRSWHQNMGSIVNNPPKLDKHMALMIKIELAAQETPQLLQLYVTDTELFIYNQTNDQWLSLPTAIFPQLIPNAILAA